jgi:nucleoside 2-deoxyribosyltransferase
MAKREGSFGEIRRVYLAGPFFSEDEVRNIEYAESVLEAEGVDYFSPMHNGVDAQQGTPEWTEKIFLMDVEEIRRADAVVALYYGSSGDTGTAWECGYAAAIGRPVVVVHVNRDGDSNLMMHCGCTTNIYLDELADFDLEAMPVFQYDGKMF